jgi:phage tail sheath protein FI
MPEYLAPGVYVEEVSFSAPTIEGVGTTTTGFAGPTVTGPVAGAAYGGLTAANSPTAGIPQLLTSFGDFQNVYGGYNNLTFSGTPTINYMAMAVKAFFDNGGSMLYVSRVFSPASPTDAGYATVTVGSVTAAARFPGAMLTGQKVTVTLVAQKTQNVANLPAGTLLAQPGATPTFYTNGASGTFMSNATPSAALPTALPANLYVLTLQVTAPGASGQQQMYSNLGFDPAGANFIGAMLGVNPPRAIDQLQNQIYLSFGTGTITPIGVFNDLFTGGFPDPSIAGNTPPSVTYTLASGDDGAQPNNQQYTTALSYFTPLEDIAIVATPGAGAYADQSIQSVALIEHVSQQRAYRVAILETAPALLAAGFESFRAQMDSSYAAMYVPWVITPNPLAAAGTSIPAQITVPPTGFMAGIYARSDEQNSVAKAPANEVVLGAIDFERHIGFAEQSTLNPLGINCLRFFPDRGYRVWGARTVSSDTSLMYVNVRRYLVYLEHSIDNGTQWAVFENNGPSLWARVTDSIESFLTSEFAEGNLLGTSPSNAFFVRCDRTTMTQNDLDNGRLICIIGVCLLKPAEFVIFRIGQITASAQS